MKKFLTFFVLMVFLWSCQTKSDSESTDSTNNMEGTAEKSAAVFSLEELWATDTVCKTPESVFYDSKRGVLYVANMNRIDEGETGFISKLALDGSLLELEWISGLIEPRGMGVYGDYLFVADMNRVLMIDIEKGLVESATPVEGAIFLNDLCVSGEGKVYFSDSGTGKIQTFENGLISDWFEDTIRTNGLHDLNTEMLMSAQGLKSDGAVWILNKESMEHEVLATGVRVDGIEYTGIEDYFILTEWSGRIHIISKEKKILQTLLDTEKKMNTADLAFNLKEKILYVPTFFDNRVIAYKLHKN